MSIVQSVKEAVGLDSDHPTYECVDCGASFEGQADPGSYWFKCPECGSEEPLGGEE